METAIEDTGLDRGPTLTSSWDAACGALTQSLLLTRTGPRDQDVDFEQLLEPPVPRCAGPGPGDSHAAEEPGGGREPRRAREPSEAAGTARVGGDRWCPEVGEAAGKGCALGRRGRETRVQDALLLQSSSPPTRERPNLVFGGNKNHSVMGKDTTLFLHSVNAFN